MKKNIITKTGFYSLGIVITAGMIYASGPGKSNPTKSDLSENYIEITRPETATTLPQQIRSVFLRDNFSFAGESVPTHIEDVRERLERELTSNSYFHSNTILNLKKSQRFFPLIDQILRQQGIPLDFKYVAVIESNLDNVASPAGAKGFWQLMPAVAKSYGLEINSEIDERYNLEKSTVAATKLIHDYRKKFGSWTNAAAAYNIGEGNFRREMDRQKETDYYDMNFGSETNRYVFRILAIKEILNSPEKFGFYISPKDRYEPRNTRTVTVTKTISSLADFAHEHQMSYRQLKVYNPWLLSNQLTVSAGKSYEVMVPAS